MRRHICILLALACLAPNAQAEENFFGERKRPKGSLIGIIYDLKQTQKREPTGVTPEMYAPIVKDFLDRGWDETVLNRYFRSARPLYTTQVFIPQIGADQAPKAFEVDNVMKPSCWVVHYKGQVSPPGDGTYRFLCYSDDMIVVAINGKVVCDGSRADTPVTERFRPEDRPGRPIPASNGDIQFGQWVELEGDELVDLDILIGERPGGVFSAFVMIEKQGETYPVLDNGVPQYPVFQLKHEEVKDYGDRAPANLTRVEHVWTAYP